MAKKKDQAKFDSLVAAVAANQTIADWCRDNGIKTTTAYNWSQEPAFKTAVREFHAAARLKASGLLSRALTAAVVKALRIMDNPLADLPTQLRAADLVMTKAMIFAEHIELDDRMSELEKTGKGNEEVTDQKNG